MKTFFATLCVLLLAFNANAVFLKKPSQATYSVFNQLKSVENSIFGKKVLDTIALQMKNKSPLGDIAKLLADIRTDLATQQANADTEHNAFQQECDDIIADYERRINEYIKTRDDAQAEIQTLEAEISELKGTIANLGVQLQILGQREVAIEQARTQDKESFKERQESTVQVVAALDLIIEKLQTLEANTNDDNLVLAELNKIGSSNPIMALAQVAASFSQESLDNVVQKMTDLRSSINASIEHDKQEEQDADAEFKALLQEVKKTIKDVSSQQKKAQEELTHAEQALAIQEGIFEQAVDNLLKTREDKANKELQCEQARAKYEEDKASRAEEIEIVKQVEAIIATKLDTMKDYLKDRANGE